MIKRIILILFIFSSSCVTVYGQAPNCPPAGIVTANCNGGFIPSPPAPENHDFVFDTFSKYYNGIVFNAATRIKLNITEIGLPGTCRWKLHIMPNHAGPLANQWEQQTNYGSTAGNLPDLDILKVRVRNRCNTSLTANGIYPTDAGGFVDMPNRGAEIAIIDNSLFPNANATSCDPNVNSAGSYLTNNDEFNFFIDYKIVPGVNVRPGFYYVELRFCLFEDN